MDYFYQFLVNFIATTIGVILALVLGRWYGKVKESEEAESIKAKILIELKTIRTTMLNIRNGTALLLNPIKMPTYQGFICTAPELPEEEIIRIYGKRWQIEVFFKTCKSVLNLAGECHSLSYDALTAHTAIVLTRYMLLALE